MKTQRPVKPTTVTNEHGARFLLLGYTETDSATGPVECAVLVDETDCRVELPVASFRKYFSVER